MGITISGHSDDIVSIDGFFSDELSAAGVRRTIVVGDTATGGVRVSMKYAPKHVGTGVWEAAVSPIDENVPIPWPVTVSLNANGYSCDVRIECPPDTPITSRGKRLR